ncbi:MAG: Crp/Fnr family transcriptional regulator [Candidatus Omnitrophica bacterium]|nr:Crp/Fnr family transcriptional regulator [Candidatus Omnitrophota bacterium]
MPISGVNLGKIWYLKKVNLFKGMSQEEMAALSKLVVEKTFRKKEIIFFPGQPGNHVYLLKKGVVKISRITPDGRELMLALLKPGEIFGELDAVSESSRDAQAEAHNDVMICVLARNDLIDLIKAKPELGIRLSKLIGFRRRVLENRIENLIFRSIPQRLALLLLELSEQFGEKSATGINITISLTHQDLANLIGAARATTTEFLNDFKKKSIIEMRGKLIIIKQPEALILLSRSNK